MPRTSIASVVPMSSSAFVMFASIAYFAMVGKLCIAGSFR